MDEEPKENNNGIIDPEPAAEVPVPEDASPAAGEQKPVKPAASAITGEKVFDIALGVAVIAGEALDSAAKRFSERAKELQEQSPTFWDAAEEHGRPVREKLVSALKGEAPVTAEGGAAPGSVGLADSLRHLGTNIGIAVGGGNARQSAEDEIRGLEDRVRELEQVVVSGKTGLEPEAPAEPVPAAETAPLKTESAPPAVENAAPTNSETTAESASYAFGVDQHEDTLASSPYAVSETDDERALEATGEAVDVEPSVELEAPVVSDVEMIPESPTPSPSSGRSGRKKQRDFEPEATDESASTPSPEA